MRIVAGKGGWWIVWSINGEEHADGPYHDYQTAKLFRDEYERADAEDAELQKEG